ncbi:ABC-2 type transporter-domain containing protein [Nitzschia inconspicua]|uniref:ABC-2 type transporter-domain containing protein n=1 Tax=Nitzschia inconspicua TaxID=303405 RepID=A0A9K3LFT0_9STRA|nr:ABC-2 type transporter-domain containing protein [Nitzschia inconspicua]
MLRYVEQFDVQQPELTIRETVEFCAQLRLDKNDPKIGNDDGKREYAAYVLGLMELTDIQNLQVGSFAEGGLTFEQRKRLSIACELAGSPSVIFLDEPTSGLDSRGATVVIKAMKRIAGTGRTVCATIHQPSSAVFEMFDDLLLLKKGGNVVFFGELGKDSVNLINYFESRGANPIKYGENPASWMLSCYSGENAETRMLDWGLVYKQSEEYNTAQRDIMAIEAASEESKRIVFEEVYVTSFSERLKFMIERLYRIYKRSPAYNLARLMIAVFYSFIIGSVFLRGDGRRNSWGENELSAVISTMFLSLIVIGITSISMAVPVTQQIRDVFYKHRASGMMSHSSLSWALFFAETPYICLISLLFGAIYYATVGLFHTGKLFGLFWVFFTLNVAIYSYFGQAFICLVKDTPTAGALVGALIGYNIFFSGLIVRPQYFVGPFQLGYWTAPGRFAFEGLVTTQFADNDTPVYPEFASPYFFYLNCTETDFHSECFGTIDNYVQFFFGGRFTLENFGLDVGVLVAYMILAKCVTEFALWKFNYVNT